MMMPREINVNQLATAVMWWLSYSSAIGRDYVLSESAIKFPVAEYLERSRTTELILEFEHPKLSRKRIDLYFKNHLDEKNVFEFKYIKNDSTRKTDEKQRVFDDLMRLYLCLADNHKGHFLICGSQLQFTSNFQTLLLRPNNTDNLFIQPKFYSTAPKSVRPDGFYKEWFSFDSNSPTKVIDLNTANSDYKKIKRYTSNLKLTIRTLTMRKPKQS